MKTQKLSLNSIKNVLSRAEMKKIMAGSGDCYNCTVYYSGGSTMSGTSCGSSIEDARDNLGINIENHPDVYGSPSAWSCS